MNDAGSRGGRPKGPAIDDRARLLFMADLRAADPHLSVTRAAEKALPDEWRDRLAADPENEGWRTAAQSQIKRLERAYKAKEAHLDRQGRRRRKIAIGRARQKWRGNPLDFIPPLPVATLAEGSSYARQEETVRAQDAKVVEAVMRSLDKWTEWTCAAPSLAEAKMRRRHLAEQLTWAARYLGSETL